MIIGIDVGGTHIDGVLMENKEIIKKVKNPVDKKDLFSTIYNSLLELVIGIDKKNIERINLSTTISTNAIVEDKTEPVLMVLQEGPGINNEFEKYLGKVEYLNGYVDHRGKVVKNFNPENLIKILKNTKNEDFNYLGVVTKFSTRNPEVENKVFDYFKDNLKFISRGHKISGILNYPRRVNSTYLNSAIHKVYSNFIENLEKSLEKENILAPIYILKADGGTIKISDSKTMPIESILSGPAASFMGITALENTNLDSIYLDIGGTTTDIFFLVDGSPIFEPKGIEIDGYKTLVRGIFSRSIGLGGDSFLDIVNGEIKIGPERKDKPLVLGGKYPSLTDAMAVLDLIDFGDKKRALDGIKILARKINKTPLDFSELVLKAAAKIIKNTVETLLEEINSKPLYTVREILENRKISPKEIKIIGGPAKILEKYIAEEFGIPTIIPNHFEIANAIGSCLSKVTFEVNLIADTKRKILNIPELGIYQDIDKSFNLDKARSMVIKELEKIGESNENIEIIEESTFNMVDGYDFYRNIRVKGQIKPGLLFNLWRYDNGK